MTQQHTVANEGNAVLYEPEGAGHQAQRPRGGLAPGSRELVIKLRILEMAQVEGERLFENHDVDTLAELGTQQGLEQRQASLGRRDAGDEDALEHHELDDVC